MTTMALPSVGASSACPEWDAIDWPTALKQVQRLQMRIAKAARERKHGRTKSLHRLQTRSAGS
ncbi:MAG: reverse transcriptase N-terminal domain-containing protein [Deltaproteobacteria bacterium]|nr:reverse transcriptase N-terminal domain-containing protein [Deltaproteobacteria bacterium]